MKRVLALLLAVAMVFCLAACKPEQDNSLKPLRSVGTYKPGTEGFYQIQSEFYDYFLPLIGFGHVSFTDDGGSFSDAELIQFAVLQLSYEGIDTSEGLTQREIDRTTKRHLGQKAQRLEGQYLTYDKDNDKYYPQNVKYEIGQMMALQSLTVQEDGVCVGEFYRSKWPADLGESREEEDIKQDFLNGWYEGLEDVQHIRMTFRERNTTVYGYYIEVLTIEQLGGK